MSISGVYTGAKIPKSFGSEAHIRIVNREHTAASVTTTIIKVHSTRAVDPSEASTTRRAISRLGLLII